MSMMTAANTTILSATGVSGGVVSAPTTGGGTTTTSSTSTNAIDYDYEDSNKDMCPICKTDRYLSPDVKFLVNPECYHKICESCVDRIFSLGPAQCPYKRCDKILRKNKFKTQIFDDVGVEKEVDIRKRVFGVFNKDLNDFDGDLKKFNEYLEHVEEIVYKLDHGIDVEETERQLKDYEELNKQLILSNIERNKKEFENFEEREKFQKEMRLKKRMLERQIEEEDKSNKEWAKREIINRLAAASTSGSLSSASSASTSIVDNTQDVIESVKSTVKLKKSSARRKLDELNRFLQDNPYFSSSNPNSTQNTLLYQQQHGGSVIPFTPFNGDRDIEPRRFTIEEELYDDPFLKDLQNKKEFIASGFRTDYVYERVLTEAFMGLGCVISEEL
ncbi:TFIIH/NER complex subunit TFB3 NDAI_0H01080 [Naumovozyma dairenensis CBS 421]|uniref:RNA polymerase II transcription factor B subunit 3 n=1 Tax=Naumovozyma dairenensis (strain ATCC 10597 / BCRC 20456 / CBS 421 / NBRC 0211 / NRRL Y-12639) TaxID=1071378 RepID=G0WES1_NAUDC|nr:hypothetical protein NDAI_0H01080 [Naumovozyma dairenensis CBS 421]CCD26282.1 hypothetical protein NDAI_0H01080 [Naumovozyma dairenensis CBS 421]